MTTILTLFLQPVIKWSIITFYYRCAQRDSVMTQCHHTERQTTITHNETFNGPQYMHCYNLELQLRTSLVKFTVTFFYFYASFTTRNAIPQ